MKRSAVILLLLTVLSHVSFSQKTSEQGEVYKSDNLIITQISADSYMHTSFKQTNDFGNVPCNGLIVINNNEAIVFDTPTNDKTADELIGWINDSLRCKINAVIPTHFHDDCLGGLRAFTEKNIPSYSSYRTIKLAEENKSAVPGNGFTDSLILSVGNEFIVAKFLGEGHTKDNIVGYYPPEKVLFGGCLLKEIDASKGYLGDANVKEWSATVERVKNEFPEVKVVVPGHGEFGDSSLLDYTIQLFRNN
ncbi:MAG: subclass B1 metallo-beta-lactamase [Ignavibacteriaceae bacterium]|nr:subclass B1 metallo-beta-lactamase [Ignavibacteriaceae bacterium]